MQPVLRRRRSGQSGGAASGAARLRAMEQIRRLLPGPECAGRPGAASDGPRRVLGGKGDDISDRRCPTGRLFRR